jgi:hypothetical protein
LEQLEFEFTLNQRRTEKALVELEGIRASGEKIKNLIAEIKSKTVRPPPPSSSLSSSMRPPAPQSSSSSAIEAPPLKRARPNNNNNSDSVQGEEPKRTGVVEVLEVEEAGPVQRGKAAGNTAGKRYREEPAPSLGALAAGPVRALVSTVLGWAQDRPSAALCELGPRVQQGKLREVLTLLEDGVGSGSSAAAAAVWASWVEVAYPGQGLRYAKAALFRLAGAGRCDAVLVLAQQLPRALIDSSDLVVALRAVAAGSQVNWTHSPEYQRLERTLGWPPLTTPVLSQWPAPAKSTVTAVLAPAITELVRRHLATETAAAYSPESHSTIDSLSLLFHYGVPAPMWGSAASIMLAAGSPTSLIDIVRGGAEEEAGTRRGLLGLALQAARVAAALRPAHVPAPDTACELCHALLAVIDRGRAKSDKERLSSGSESIINDATAIIFHFGLQGQRNRL